MALSIRAASCPASSSHRRNLGSLLALLLLALAPTRGEAQARGLGDPRSGQTSVNPASADPASEEPPSTDEVPPGQTSNRPPTSQDLGDVPPPPGDYSGSLVYPARNLSPAAAAQAQVASPDATRLRVLGANLRALGGTGNSTLNGIVSIISGGAVAGLGAYLRLEGEDPLISSYFFILGGANITRGIVELALPTGAGDDSIAFENMPQRRPEEVQSRIHFGETALASVARRNRISRMLNGSINIAAALAIVPLHLAPNGFRVDDFYDVFILVGSGISLVTGIVGLVTRSSAERRWLAYQSLDARLESATQAGLRLDDLRIVPTRGGGALSLVGHF